MDIAAPCRSRLRQSHDPPQTHEERPRCRPFFLFLFFAPLSSHLSLFPLLTPSDASAYPHVSLRALCLLCFSVPLSCLCSGWTALRANTDTLLLGVVSGVARVWSRARVYCQTVYDLVSVAFSSCTDRSRCNAAGAVPARHSSSRRRVAVAPLAALSLSQRRRQFYRVSAGPTRSRTSLHACPGSQSGRQRRATDRRRQQQPERPSGGRPPPLRTLAGRPASVCFYIHTLASAQCLPMDPASTRCQEATAALGDAFGRVQPLDSVTMATTASCGHATARDNVYGCPWLPARRAALRGPPSR